MSDQQEVAPRQRGMTPFPMVLAAGVPQSFDVEGDYFHVQTAPVDDLQVRFDEGAPAIIPQGMGLRRYYSRVTLESATGQTVKVLAGFGSVFDGRASVTGLTLNTQIAPGNTLDNGARVSCVVSSATQLLAADATRLYALIKNPSTNTLTMYIGTAAVTDADGIPLEPGETLPLATTAAIYAYNADGALAENLWAAAVREV